MLQKNLECITESTAVVSIFIAGIITIPDHSLESNIDLFARFVLWISLYFIQSKCLVSKYLMKRNVKSYVLYSLLTLVITIVPLIIIRLVHLQEMFYRRYYIISTKLDYVYNWLNFEDLFIGSFVVLLCSLIYGILRSIKYPNNFLFRKALPSTLSVIVIMLSLLSVVFIINENIGQPEPVPKKIISNENIVFIENEYGFSTLSDVLAKIDFSKKPICIMFWTPSCGSQYYQVKQLEDIRKSFSNKDIDFLYICCEYEDKFSLWNEFIVDENIGGTHIYLSRKDIYNILIEDMGVHTGVAHVLLLDRTQNHILINSHFPSVAVELIEAISKL